MTDDRPAERRPVGSRETGWARAIASALVRAGVSANGISLLSVAFATAGATAMLYRLWWVAAVCVVLRLLCNLFDGMVAVGSGRASKVGELYNEVPDRLSDVLLIVPLGHAPGSLPALGWAAAVGALLVAYVRAQGAVAGARQAFGGVMAKQQRMWVVVACCLFLEWAPAPWVEARVVAWALGGLTVGCAITAATRLRVIAHELRAR